MARKISLLVFLGFFCMNLSAAEKDGYVLLDKVVMTFQEMAESGSGGKDKVDNALEAIMADAKKAKAQGSIDPVFFKRFHRLLMILKLAVVESPEGILGPLVERELSEFVEDVKGEKLEIKGTKGIGTIAGATAEEIINLHLYLDNRKDRDKLMEEFTKKFEIKKK